MSYLHVICYSRGEDAAHSADVVGVGSLGVLAAGGYGSTKDGAVDSSPSASGTADPTSVSSTIVPDSVLTGGHGGFAGEDWFFSFLV